jgi:hypothetical protein
MKKQEGTPRMRKKQAVWVFDSGTPLRALTIERTLRIVRLERERQILGGRARDVLTRLVPKQQS